MIISLTLLIPAAGLGSRLFPVTWAIPKELFPLNNKPALHYVLEEALSSNISKVICITSPRKESLVSYLTYDHKKNLVIQNDEEKSRLDELDCFNKKISYEFIIQQKPTGIGNAILLAQNKIKEDFFCMAYPDDIMINKNSGLSQLIELNKKYNCSVILVEKVSSDKINLYGSIKWSKRIDTDSFYIDSIIEKPKLEEAPSLYAIIGRHLLSKDIFAYLDKQNIENPCFITAMNEMLKDNKKIIAVEVSSKRYDIGTIPGWLKAVKEINNI